MLLITIIKLPVTKFSGDYIDTKTGASLVTCSGSSSGRLNRSHAPFSPGDRLGPYEIVSVLGKGGWARCGACWVEDGNILISLAFGSPNSAGLIGIWRPTAGAWRW
jgi:hypothetical protein